MTRPAQDLTGSKFGKLMVLDYAGNSRWNVRCECGELLTCRTEKLKTGGKTACGKDCIYPNLTGTVVGDFRILERSPNPPRRYGKFWKCQCSRCGAEVVRSTRMVNQYGGHCPCRTILPQNGSALNCLVSAYRCSAKDRGLLFGLTTEQCRVLFSGNCVFCGCSPSQVRKINSSRFIYNGIDRLDPTFGYIASNVASCCKVCNLRKGKMTATEFKDWIDRVHFNFRPELL